MKQRVAFLGIVSIVMTLNMGCQIFSRASAPEPIRVPSDSGAELVDFLGDQPFVTAEAGYRSAHLLWKGEMAEAGFDELAAQLSDAGIASANWDYMASTYLTRGDVGFMVCRACEIDTGLNWQLTGFGRYAYRELQYQGIAGPGGEMDYVSGGEFQGIIRKADEYLSKKSRQEISLGSTRNEAGN